MINFIKDNSEFDKLEIKLFNSLNILKDFSENPFDEKYTHFLAFEFDYIHDDSFFEGVKKFLINTNLEGLVFYTFSPSPRDYFYEKYSFYNAFRVSIHNINDEFEEILMRDPSETSSESIALASEDISLFSESDDDWLILGSKDWEMGIIGFTNEGLKVRFLESFTENADMYMSIKKQVEVYDEMLCLTRERLLEYRKLENRYTR